MFDIDNTTIICIDIQEKLVKMLDCGERIKNNAVKLLKTAKILNIDTIISEQYPKGLGESVQEIKEDNFKTVEKTTFSALRTDEFYNEFKKIKNKNVLIFGIETHICVLQTVIDLIKKDYNVFVVSDCSRSRSEENHSCALSLMEKYGAKVITLEIALFNFLRSSKHPNFKEIQGLIK